MAKELRPGLRLDNISELLVDANPLRYASRPASGHHERSRAWLEDVLVGSEPVRLAWATVLAYLRR